MVSQAATVREVTQIFASSLQAGGEFSTADRAYVARGVAERGFEVLLSRCWAADSPPE